MAKLVYSDDFCRTQIAAKEILIRRRFPAIWYLRLKCCNKSLRIDDNDEILFVKIRWIYVDSKLSILKKEIPLLDREFSLKANFII